MRSVTKPIVLLDVDGVIADFGETFHRAAEWTAGKVLPDPDVRGTWDIEKAYGLSEVEMRHVWMMMNRPEVAFHLLPCDHAIAGVKQLLPVADVYFVTSPIKTSPTWCYDRMNWLIRHFGYEQGQKVIPTSYKQLVSGQIFVDDRPANVTKWQTANSSSQGILWHRDYNEVEGTKLGLCSMADWGQLRKAVEDFF